eukprot:12783571-Ditylum_brightwellii.AAC.1
MEKHDSFTEGLLQHLSDDADFQSAVEEEEGLEESEHEDLASINDIKHEEEPEDNEMSDNDSHFPHPSCKTLDMSTCMLNTMDQYPTPHSLSSLSGQHIICPKIYKILSVNLL